MPCTSRFQRIHVRDVRSITKNFLPQNLDVSRIMSIFAIAYGSKQTYYMEIEKASLSLYMSNQ